MTSHAARRAASRVVWLGSAPRHGLAALPQGTLPVGAGLMVYGAASYLHLTIAGHVLPRTGMAAMSVLWSIVYVLGLGVYFPIEQELIRQVAARRAVGDGAAPVVRRGGALAAAVCAATLAPLAAARPIAAALFGGDTAMVAALGAASVALAVASVSRGALAGLGRFGAYGSQLAVDGAARVLVAGALGAAGVRSAAAFGLVLCVAPVVAVAATLAPLLARLRPGPAMPWRAMTGRLGLLILTMLLAQIVVNVAVINVRLLSPSRPGMVTALLAGVVLARIPLFAFTSVQTSLLPGLAGAAAAGEVAHFRRLLTRGCAVVAVLGLVGGLPVVVLGPWLTRIMVATPSALSTAGFACLASGTLFYMLAMVLGQAAMSLSRHRMLVISWLLGVAVLAAVTAGPGAVATRVAAAFAFASLTAALALAAALSRGRAVPTAATATYVAEYQ